MGPEETSFLVKEIFRDPSSSARISYEFPLVRIFLRPLKEIAGRIGNYKMPEKGTILLISCVYSRILIYYVQ